MSFPTFRSIKETTVTGSSPYSVAMPDEAVSPGDLLLMILSGANEEQFNTPAGWTSVARATLNATMGMAIFGKRASGSEGGTSVSVSRTGNGNVAAQVYRYSDVNGSTVGDCVFASSAAGSTIGNQMNASAVSPGVGAQDFSFIAAGGYLSGTLSSYPSGYSGGTHTIGTGVRLATCRRNLNASSEDPGSINKSTSGGWIAYAIAVRGIGFVLETKSLDGASTSSGDLSSFTAITKSLDGASSNSGEVSTHLFLVLSQLAEGVSGSVGNVVASALRPLSLSGESSNEGGVFRKVKTLLEGACTSLGEAVASVTVFLRLAMQDQDPRVDGRVKYLVEMSDKAIPNTSPGDNALYEKGLRAAPEFERSAGSASVAVSGLSQVRLRVSNLSQMFNSKDIGGWFIRVLRVFASQVVEFRGVVTEWSLGEEVEILAEDREAVVFNDQFPKRVITKELFENLPDRDAGKAIPVVHNKVVKMPCRLIGADELNGVWDYLLGEGVGKFGYFQDVFAAYHEDAAMPDISGSVQGVSGSQITLETNDTRKAPFYLGMWFQTIDPVTGDVLEELEITSQPADNKVQLASSPSVSPSGKNYRIKPWRFYNGSQSSPYPGIAFLRFKKRLGERNRLDDVYADVDGLPAANVVRELEDWLESDTWGAGLEVSQASFDALAGDSEIGAIETEWAVMDRADSGDIIDALLDVRGMGLKKEGTELAIEGDVAVSSSGAFEYGTGVRNILSVNGGLRHLHVNDKVKNLTVLYRRNMKEANAFLGTQSGAVNSSGVDSQIEAPMFYSHEAANRYLYYKMKKLAAEARRLNITVNEDGEGLSVRDRITVKVPLLGIDEDFLIVSILRKNGAYDLELRPYDETTYEWSKVGEYPDEPDNVVPTDFENTEPAQVSSVGTSAGYVSLENGTRTGYIDVSWTVPNDGNYLEAVVLVKENGQPASSYVEAGKGYSSARVPSLEVGKTYDVMVESRNKYGLTGVGVEKTGTQIPGYNKTPKTPANVVGKGKLGAVSWEWDKVTQNTDNSSIGAFLKGYEYRVWTSSSGGSQVYPKGGGVGFTTDTRVEITDTDDNLTTAARNLYLEVRAVAITGNASSYSSRAVAGTGAVGRLDAVNGDFNKQYLGGGDSVITISTSGWRDIAQASGDFVSGQTAFLHLSAVFEYTGGSSGTILAWRVLKDGSPIVGSTAGVDIWCPQNEPFPFSWSTENVPGSGSHTYTFQAAYTFTGPLEASYRRLIVNLYKR